MDCQICRHIKTNGERCKSPRLRTSNHCFFHHRMLARHHDAVHGRRSDGDMKPLINGSGELLGYERTMKPLDLGPLEDRSSVQMAISTVINALAAGRLEQQRATALLYGLQLASSNCPAVQLGHGYAYDPIREMVETPEGIALALPDRGLNSEECQRILDKPGDEDPEGGDEDPEDDHLDEDN